MSDKIESQNNKQDDKSEFIRMYYKHQYERMAKLEDHRLIVTNIIFTISLISLAFGFDKDKTLNIVTGIAIPVIIMTANIFAILYINSTRHYARIHRLRAKEVLKEYASYIFEIDKRISESPEIRYLSQGKFQFYLHILLIMASIIPILSYIF